MPHLDFVVGWMCVYCVAFTITCSYHSTLWYRLIPAQAQLRAQVALRLFLFFFRYVMLHAIMSQCLVEKTHRRRPTSSSLVVTLRRVRFSRTGCWHVTDYAICEQSSSACVDFNRSFRYSTEKPRSETPCLVSVSVGPLCVVCSQSVSTLPTCRPLVRCRIHLEAYSPNNDK